MITCNVCTSVDGCTPAYDKALPDISRRCVAHGDPSERQPTRGLFGAPLVWLTIYASTRRRESDARPMSFVCCGMTT